MQRRVRSGKSGSDERVESERVRSKSTQDGARHGLTSDAADSARAAFSQVTSCQKLYHRHVMQKERNVSRGCAEGWSGRGLRVTA